MESKVSRAIRIWEVRHTRLEQSKHVLLFEEQVPIVSYNNNNNRIVVT